MHNNVVADQRMANRDLRPNQAIAADTDIGANYAVCTDDCTEANLGTRTDDTPGSTITPCSSRASEWIEAPGLSPVVPNKDFGRIACGNILCKASAKPR